MKVLSPSQSMMDSILKPERGRQENAGQVKNLEVFNDRESIAK